MKVGYELMGVALSSRTKNYWVEVRIGWNGWLPDLHQYLWTSSIGEELAHPNYWRRLWGLIKEFYNVHYQHSTALEMANFFLRTKMVVVHVQNKNLTKRQMYQIAYYVKNKILDQKGIDTIIDWLRLGW